MFYDIFSPRILLSNCFISKCKVSLCERNTFDVSNLLALVKILVASQHKRQRNKSLPRLKTPTWCAPALFIEMNYSYASDLSFKNFCKLAKQAETKRNYQKQVLVMIKHCQGNSQINSIPEQRVFLHNLFLQNKHKSLRVQLAQADIIHSQREIKEILDPEKHTFSINSEHKSTQKSDRKRISQLSPFDHAM